MNIMLHLISSLPSPDEYPQRFQMSFESRPKRRRHPVIIFGVTISFSCLFQEVYETVLSRSMNKPTKII